MLTKRVIPCLDVRDGRVVKGVRFTNLRDAGDPVEQASRYEEEGADEIVMLDVSATPEARSTATDTVKSLRRALSIPLTVGGGVRTIEDALALLEAGADKVGVNTAAVERPDLLRELSAMVGAQCVVLAIDAASMESSPPSWEVVTRSGRHRTELDAIEWAQQGERLGAGEILLTSWNRDGTGRGYDLDLVRAMANAVRTPIIASGGGATAEHMVEALHAGADAVLAASIFHDRAITVGKLKAEMDTRGIEVRT